LWDRQGNITRNNLRPPVTRVFSVRQFNNHNMAAIYSRKRTPKRVLEWKPIGRRIREEQGKDGLRTLKKIYRGWE